VRDTFQNAIRTLHEAGVPEAHLSALHLMAKVHSVLPFCPLIFKLQSSSPRARISTLGTSGDISFVLASDSPHVLTVIVAAGD